MPGVGHAEYVRAAAPSTVSRSCGRSVIRGTTAFNAVMQQYKSYHQHADVIYVNNATLSAQAVKELVRENYRAAGAPEFVVAAVDVFHDDLGNIHIGVPENHPLHSEAAKYEYGDFDLPPSAGLRNAIEDAGAS